MNKVFVLYFVAFLLSSCENMRNNITLPYTPEDFKSEIDGKQTRLFQLKNKNGLLVTLTNYGAKIVSIYTPDKNGSFDDILLGFKSISDYQKYSASHGAVVGPFANRIGNARFVIGADTFLLEANNGKTCLHSGPSSWYRKVWDIAEGENSVTFLIESADGDFGFPGNKKARVTYTLTNDNELRIDYKATTDKPCHFNLTNHSYFNLNGEGNGDILNHIATINAEKVTQVDETMIPTGEILDIKGSELDFTTPRVIGEKIDAPNQMLQHAIGYDFNYIINKKEDEMAFAASVLDPESGRFMEVFTTEPGVQFYTGNHLKGVETGKKGIAYSKRSGFCLETQHFPDSPNKPQFPATLLLPGMELNSTTIYKFSVKQ